MFVYQTQLFVRSIVGIVVSVVSVAGFVYWIITLTYQLLDWNVTFERYLMKIIQAITLFASVTTLISRKMAAFVKVSPLECRQ